MCTDPDLVAHGAMEDMAWDLFLGNKQLQEKALERYEQVGGWQFGVSFSHLSWHAIECFLEAEMAYCFGLFRSSIFCCAVVVDSELKRCAIRLFPESAKKIEKQTLGQTIAMLNSKDTLPQTLAHVLEGVDWINTVRNEVAVHSYSKEMVSLFWEDESQYLNDRIRPKSFFDSDEVKQLEKECGDGEVDWLEQLNLKLLFVTKHVISSTCLDLLLKQ